MTLEAFLPPLLKRSERFTRAIWRYKIVVLLIVLLAVSAVFYLAPSVDLAVSAHFYDQSGRFPLARDPAVHFIRNFGEIATVLVIMTALLGLIGPLIFNRPRVGLWPHQAAYVLSVYVVAPGLIVNWALKEHVGRVRPRDVVEFGGDAHFTPIWALSDGCTGNCSFASGEAAAAAALLCLIPLMPKGDRLAGGLALTAIAIAVSFSRIVVGAHFLSDVLIAWVIVLFFVVALKPLFFGERGRVIDAAIAHEANRHARFRRWIVTRIKGAPDAPLAAAAAEATAGKAVAEARRTAAGPEIRMSSEIANSVKPRMKFKRLSVIVPAKNEAQNLAILVREITEALGKRAHEIIVVDDGSTDDTGETLARLKADGAKVRHLRHDRSAGQSRAIRTGVLAASGDLIVTIDGDGQNDPAFIPTLVDTLESAAPNVRLVAGQRVGRQDTRIKKMSSRFANAIRTAILKDRTRDTGCGLKAMPTELFRKLPYFDGWHRYFPALVLREGYEIAHVDVRDRERRFGKSNYGVIDRGLRGILDLYGVWWLIRRARTVPEVTEIIPEEPA